MSSSPIINTNVDEEAHFEGAYIRLRVDINALKACDVLHVNLDVPSTVATVLGALPEIEDLRVRIQKLPEFDQDLFNKLEDYAFMLSYTHTRYVTTCESSDDLQVLAQEGGVTRDCLRNDSKALATRGLINPEALDNCKGLPGYKNIASDLQILATVLGDNWSNIEGKCAIQRSELDRANKVAARMLRLVGLREQAPSTASSPADERARAFTLLVNCYDQARRAVQYLCWNDGDADEIAPSLYAGRKQSPKPKPTAEEPAVPQPPAPANAPAPVDPNNGPFMV